MYIYNNNISDIDFLSGYSVLTELNVSSNKNLKTLSVLNSSSLITVNAAFCSLGENENDYDTTKENNGKDAENDALSFLANCKNVTSLNVSNNKIKWLSYINLVTTNFSQIYINNNPNFIISEVVYIKDKYNNSSGKKIDDIYKKYLVSSDVVDYSRSNTSSTVEKLSDTSDEILALEALSQADKAKVKLLNLSGNDLLTDAKLNELLSGIKADGTVTGNGSFKNLVYLNLSYTGLSKLDFLEAMPNLKQLVISYTSVGITPDEGSLYCSEFAKIDLYCSELLGLSTTSEYVDIEDIDGYVVRGIGGFYYGNYYNGDASGKSYIKHEWPASLTAQLGKLGTRFPKYFRAVGLKFPDTIVDLSDCTSLKRICLDYGQKFKLPSSINIIEDDLGSSIRDISNCTNLTRLSFQTGTSKEKAEDYFKQIYDNDLKISTIVVNASNNLDCKNIFEYLKKSGVSSITVSGNIKINSIIGDDPDTDYIEFGSLTNLTLNGAINFDTSLIKNCKSLINLTLKDCGINTIQNLSELTLLQTLDLSNNSISDLSGLTNMTQLADLNLSSNSLADSSLTILKTLHEENALMILDISTNSTLTADTVAKKLLGVKDWTKKTGF